MKIAIIAGVVLPIPPLKYGGVERDIYYLIKGLKELGHEPVLFGPGDSQVPCEVIPIVPHSLPFKENKEEDAANEVLRLEAEKTLQKLIKERGHEFDIINVHSFNDATDFELYASFPHLITYHGPYIIDIINRLYKFKDKLNFAAISWNQIEFLREQFRFFSVIYNGFDPAEFDFVSDPQEYMSYLGRFSPEKTPHYALKLAKELGMPLVAGGVMTANDMEYYQKFCAKYFDQGDARYLGELGMEGKNELFGNAKYNIHLADWREPFGNIVIEAGYCGTPTVALERGAMPEIIEHGRTGIVVEDVNAAYVELKWGEHQFDREYIRERTARMFNYKVMTLQHIRAFEDVLKSPSHEQLEGVINEAWEYRKDITKES